MEVVHFWKYVSGNVTCNKSPELSKLVGLDYDSKNMTQISLKW